MAFFNEIITRFTAESKGAGKVNSDINRLKKSGSALTKTLKTAAKAFVGLFAVQGISRFLKESVKLADVQQKAEGQLLAALGEREGAQQKIIKSAQELQKVTLFGDEQTIQAATKLAGFLGDQEDQIVALLPIIQDYAEFTGTDLNSAALLFGKTLASTTNALARNGIEVEGAANSQERFNSLVENFSKTSIAGQARRAALEGAGSFQQLANAIGDVQEEIGAQLIPLIKPLAIFINDAISNLDPLKDSLKGVSASFKTLGESILTLLSPFAKLGEVLGIFNPDDSTSAGARFISFLSKWVDLVFIIPNQLARLTNVFGDLAVKVDGFTEKWLGLSIVQNENIDITGTLTQAMNNLSDEIEEKYNKALTNATVKTDGVVLSLKSLSDEVSDLQKQLDESPLFSQQSIDLAKELKEKTDELTEATEFYNKILEGTQKVFDAVVISAGDFTQIADELKESFAEGLVDGLGEAEVGLKGLGRTLEDFTDGEGGGSAEFSFLERLGAKLNVTGEEVKDLALNLTSALGQISDEFTRNQIAQLDAEIAIQQQRVDAALSIAEEGNAELVEIEKERLEKLNQEREKSAQKQAKINAAIIAANSAVAISEGIVSVIAAFNPLSGGGLGRGIATSIALAATLASSIAAINAATSGIGFHEGTESVKGKFGRDKIPAMVEPDERIISARSNQKYRKDYNIIQRGLLPPGVVSDLYRNKYKMKDNRGEISSYLNGKMSIDLSSMNSRLESIEQAIKGQPSTKVNLTKEGLYMAVNRYQSDLNKYKNL